ncbi:MAG: hypothetical protein F6K23_30895 [Okeania sp. SIO2C9]|nr:hypothetical protein [Okeania sp. SIO2C9]NEQ77038.1 hypothetical protein [Okeania sp. SIO2C9]
MAQIKAFGDFEMIRFLWFAPIIRRSPNSKFNYLGTKLPKVNFYNKKFD